MSLTLHIPDAHDLKPRLTVFGVGGAGGNAVNNMIARALEGVDFVVANTDAQALSISDASDKIQLGEELTEGLGAGAKPEIGSRAAEESIEKITDHLMGSHMCFITAGMGGGTGTGAAPVIAQAARQMGILTVGVVTKPFHFEGSRRMVQAEAGIEELQNYVDTLIVIPNQNLFRIASEKTTFSEAFGMADDVLYQGVKGVTDLMVRPGMVNLDFADIRSVMDEMGKAMMGTGEAEGEDRALVAAENAIANPLLDEISLKGAKGVLINITGGDDLTLHEVDEASNKIRSEVDPDANIIFGSAYDPDLNGKIRVSVVATGIDVDEAERAKPRARTQISNERKSTASMNDSKETGSDVEVDLFAQAAQRTHSAETPEQPRFEASRPSEANAPRVNMRARDEVVSKDDTSMPADVDVQNAPSPKKEVVQPQLDIMDAELEVSSHQKAVRFDETETGELAFADQDHDASLQNEYVEQDIHYTAPMTPRVEVGRDETVKTRLQEAARAVPVSAPTVRQDMAPTARSGVNSFIKKLSGQDDGATRNLSAPTASHLPPRRAEPPHQRMDEGERQRVDIPAFLRRKAN